MKFLARGILRASFPLSSGRKFELLEICGVRICIMVVEPHRIVSVPLQAGHVQYPILGQWYSALEELPELNNSGRGD